MLLNRVSSEDTCLRPFTIYFCGHMGASLKVRQYTKNPLNIQVILYNNGTSYFENSTLHMEA
jgi:hypothetical protein